MKKRVIFILLSFLIFYCFSFAQELDSAEIKLYSYLRQINSFAKYIPQEKVYLHFDNTNYFKGDDIWFKCYVVTSELNKPTLLSKTLYVELLNPGGEIIEKKILRIENGQCHGNFTLRQPIFYPGFYEVRAYTKYMLNFGDDIIFSRVFPVFDISEKGEMYKQSFGYQTKRYPSVRKKAKKRKKVNIDFYPEGGNLVMGLKSEVAFQITDENGNYLSAEGAVYDSGNNKLTEFHSAYQGRGKFSYIPIGESAYAEVKYNGKTYKYDMPKPLPHGIVMNVDNVTCDDSIKVRINKNAELAGELVGVALMCRGKIYNVVLLNTGEENISFGILKERIPSGVSQVIIFNPKGQILADRLIFINHNDFAKIDYKQNASSYKPYEKIDIDFTVRDKADKPLKTNFSLSVKDASDSLVYEGSIISNLLLSSEIKGYIDKPMYYFETGDAERMQNLDLLMMVQGWRRYIWKQMTGEVPFELKYDVEINIPIKGVVRSLVRKVPKENVNVTILLKKGTQEEDDNGNLIATEVTTDSLGIFKTYSDLTGDWDLVIQVKEKDKKKNYDIILDRIFSPNPQSYTYQDVLLNFSKKQNHDYQMSGDSIDYFDSIPYDTLGLDLNMYDKIYSLNEVVITEKRKSKDKERSENINRSIAYYDVESSLDNIIDGGDYIGEDILDYLKTVNNNFVKIGYYYLRYKGKYVLFVINNTLQSPLYYNLSSVKTIYISEDISSIVKYRPPHLKPFEAMSLFSGVVFIDTYEDGESSRQKIKGIRSTTFNGYSLTKEFYSPDYDILPKEPDYRRTLYWNPSVQTDNEGKANVSFFNNSSCRFINISAETITESGVMGIGR